jgi:hypothetical protein
MTYSRKFPNLLTFHFSLLLCMTFLLTSCNPLPGSPPPVDDQLGQTATANEVATQIGDSWRINMQMSGGLAGVNRSIVVTLLGEATASDIKKNQTVSFQLSEDELGVLFGLIKDLPEAWVMDDKNCNDCFEYTLFITRDGKEFSASLNDLERADTDLDPLIKALVVLQDQLLSIYP